jgi:hypothetical protein
MACPTRARSNPAGDRPRLSGHTFDIVFGKINPLRGSQHRQQDGDTLAALHAVVDRQPIREWSSGDPDLIAAPQTRLDGKHDQAVAFSRM